MQPLLYEADGGVDGSAVGDIEMHRRPSTFWFAASLAASSMVSVTTTR